MGFITCQGYIYCRINVSHGLDAQPLLTGNNEGLVFYTHIKAFVVGSKVCPCLSPCSIWQQGWIPQALALAGVWPNSTKRRHWYEIRGQHESQSLDFSLSVSLGWLKSPLTHQVSMDKDSGLPMGQPTCARPGSFHTTLPGRLCWLPNSVVL